MKLRKQNVLTDNVALKKKHSKTGEESRYQGTAIGIPADEGTVLIEGGEVDSIRAWNATMHQRRQGAHGSPSQMAGPAIVTTESSPLSEISFTNR
jgi:transcription initiation factor TFIID subunit 3